MSVDLEPLLEVADRLATAAGAAARRHFRKPIVAEAKQDATPVSIADREAESAMRAILLRERPMDGVFGEEDGVTEGSSGLTWVLDPIDGTKAFLTGRPSFVVLISLLDEQGVPLLGVIDQPIVQDRWIGAASHGTTHNGEPVHARSCAALGDAIFSSTFLPRDPARAAAFRRVGDACRYETWGGDGYMVGLCASGWLDLVLEAGLQLYDFAPFAPIIEGAGGKAVDWNGNRLTHASDGSALCVGDPRLLEPALRLVRG
jgi:inositol-phosphate phosphatase / L-galactose 1-phosphate phosphatase / histidinol-phosphatase